MNIAENIIYMSSPNIALHLKRYEMEQTGNKYVKRTQKNYSMSFKLSVVRKYESGNYSLGYLKRKYGIQGDATIRR